MSNTLLAITFDGCKLVCCFIVKAMAASGLNTAVKKPKNGAILIGRYCWISITGDG